MNRVQLTNVLLIIALVIALCEWAPATILVLIATLLVMWPDKSVEVSDAEVRAAAEALALENVYVLRSEATGLWTAYEIGHLSIASCQSYNAVVVKALQVISSR